MKDIRRVFVLVFLTFLVTACGSHEVYKTAASKISVSKGTIPPSFIKKEEVLLIKKLEEPLKEIIEKFYKGKYLFVNSLKDYKEINKYRYILDFNVGDAGEYGKFLDFYILDRKSNKKYRTGFSATNNKMIVKAYAKKMEEARLSNLAK